jgi:hypothetical protein
MTVLAKGSSKLLLCTVDLLHPVSRKQRIQTQDVSPGETTPEKLLILLLCARV